MTEAEMWHMHFLGMANAIDCFAFMGTLISGYLAIAYFLGNRLARYQVFLISVGFVVSMVNGLAVITMETRAARHFAELLMQNFGATMFPSQPIFVYVGVVTSALLIPACLYFMYEVRKNPKVRAHTD